MYNVRVTYSARFHWPLLSLHYNLLTISIPFIYRDSGRIICPGITPRTPDRGVHPFHHLNVMAQWASEPSGASCTSSPSMLLSLSCLSLSLPWRPLAPSLHTKPMTSVQSPHHGLSNQAKCMPSPCRPCHTLTALCPAPVVFMSLMAAACLPAIEIAIVFIIMYITTSVRNITRNVPDRSRINVHFIQ